MTYRNKIVLVAVLILIGFAAVFGYTYFSKCQYNYPVSCTFKDTYTESESYGNERIVSLDKKTVLLYAAAVQTELLRQGVLKNPFAAYETEVADSDTSSDVYSVRCGANGKTKMKMDIEKQSGAIRNLIVNGKEVSLTFSRQYAAMIACIRFEEEHGIKRWEGGMFGNDAHLAATVYLAEDNRCIVRFGPDRLILASLVDVLVDLSNDGIAAWRVMLEG